MSRGELRATPLAPQPSFQLSFYRSSFEPHPCLSTSDALRLRWPRSSFLITALVCFIDAVCRVSSSARAPAWVAVPNRGREERVPASAAGLGREVREIGRRWARLCLQVFGVIPRPQSHYPPESGAPAVGTWPCPFPLLALFIDWKLTYNLIFHLLISPTEAASCQRGDGGINGNLV